MKPEEIALIKSKHNAAIIAPAGHGKTEMITELVANLPGRKLVLTHTNAGVGALSQRLDKKNVDKTRYLLSTISAFCMKWCGAYPCVASINISIKITDKDFYNDQYKGAARIFEHAWAREVLLKTYTYVIVDEYQDCVVEQHQIFLEINRTVPVYVLGDPMQSIFGWAGKLVSWSKIGFEIVRVETYPWRWDKANKELGQYLLNIRKELTPALEGKNVKLLIIPNASCVKRVSSAEAREPAFLAELNQFQSVLYLTKWPKTQCSFSQRSGGLFQNDEPQSLTDLYTVAKSLDIDDGYTRTETIYSFILNCATQVTTELGSYGKHIKDRDFDFSKIKKHQEFGRRILMLNQKHGYEDMLNVLDWIRETTIFRIYRKELFSELCRSIRFAKEREMPILEAAQQIRMMPNNQRRYSNFKKLSSRAVLSKGLEFECVAIDLEERYTATEMYVAMTRAMKAIYFITDKDSILLDVPQGI